MGKIKYILGSLGLAASFCLPVVVSAQAAPGAPPAGGTLQQRVDQRKKERAITLAKPDEVRLNSRCTTSQATIRQFQRQMTPIIANRMNKYQAIDGYLWLAIGKLKVASADTLTLEKQHQAFVDKVKAIQTDFTYFQQSLDDLAVMNCQADLVGYKAMLETARLYQAQIRNESIDIQNYIINTVKATLTQHVSALQPQTNGGQ